MANLIGLKRNTPIELDGKVLTKLQLDEVVKQFQSACKHPDQVWFDEYNSKTGKFTGMQVKFCVNCHKALNKKKKLYFWIKDNPLG